MHNDTIVLYGMGSHAKTVLSKYNVPLDCIEVVIDNSPQKIRILLEGSGIEVITWDEYVKRGKAFKGKIVISSLVYRTEIEKQILESGLFEYSQISYIDDWCNENFRGGIAGLLKQNEYKHLQKVIEMREGALENTKVLPNRSSVLKLLPHNLIAAEVGVAYGDFSQEIVDIMQPNKFYAIDIFDVRRKDFWEDKRFENSGMNHLQWYKNRFSKEIEADKVEIRQGLSWEALEEFPDGYFDYIYLDAAHHYDSVSRDVMAIKKKIKEGGIIQFNDYIMYDYKGDQFYGVVQVVNQLISESKSEVLYYCMSTDGFDDIVIRYLK